MRKERVTDTVPFKCYFKSIFLNTVFTWSVLTPYTHNISNSSFALLMSLQDVLKQLVPLLAPQRKGHLISVSCEVTEAVSMPSCRYNNPPVKWQLMHKLLFTFMLEFIYFS